MKITAWTTATNDPSKVQTDDNNNVTNDNLTEVQKTVYLAADHLHVVFYLTIGKYVAYKSFIHTSAVEHHKTGHFPNLHRSTFVSLSVQDCD